MTYSQKVERLEKRRAEREAPPATFEEKKAAAKLVFIVVLIIGIIMADLSISETIGYMIGFSIIMLPFTLFFGTLKILK